MSRWGDTVSPRGWLKWSGIISCTAATVVATCANWKAATWTTRVDISADRRFTLTAATRNTLAGLRDPIGIYVLLSLTDPLAPAFKPIVDCYASSSPLVNVRWIDPDREPGRFLALQSELGIASGASKEGKPIDDSVVVLTHGRLRSYVTIDDITQHEAEGVETEPRVEQALTRAIQRLLDDSRPVVCFTQGHGERTLDDLSPEGLSELKTKLLDDSMEPRVVDFDDDRDSLPACALLVVPEPELPLSPWVTSKIASYRDRLGSLWVMTGTVPDETGKANGVGLDALMPKLGISLGSDVVIENDPKRRAPGGFGESFFAQPLEHAITRSLGAGNPNSALRVLVTLAPTISITSGTPVNLLLQSSDEALAIRDVGSYLKSASNADAKADAGHPFALAVAAELSEQSARTKRRMVVSPASVAVNRALRSPGLVGNRAFVDGTLTWLLSRPTGVEIPGSRKAAAPLELSDSDLARLNRYVLLIMPGSALLLWSAMVAARRRCEGTKP